MSSGGGVVDSFSGEEEEEGFGLGRSSVCCFCVMGLPPGGWERGVAVGGSESGGKRERGRDGESGVRLLLQAFSRLFWVGIFFLFGGFLTVRQVQDRADFRISDCSERLE